VILVICLLEILVTFYY